MPKYIVTDYDIQGLVDGELNPEEEQHVLSYLERNSDARQRYEELWKQKMLLQKWYSSKYT